MMKVEKRFRKVIAEKYGRVREVLAVAVTEVMKLWIKSQKRETMKLNAEEVRGLSKCHREDVVMNAD